MSEAPIKIRMRSDQIDIPENDPFKNDLFDRQKSANDLKNLVGNIDTPAVIAIDGAWGTGKTTFLNLWKQSLFKSGRPVVHFNAWENDYSANALVSILFELTNQLRGCNAKFGLKNLIDDTTIKIFTDMANTSLKFCSSGLLSVDSFKNQPDIITEHEHYKKQLERFKENLRKLAKNYRSKKHYPLIIIIDELDRCRPTFAIDVLEVAKHLFSTDGVVFVLALNQRQLGHSVASIYGDCFDSIGYLEKFVDVTFRLPPVDRTKFLRSQLSEKCKELYNSRGGFENAIELLFTVYALPDFNLRTASHYIRRLDYVLASTGYDVNSMRSLVVALVMRSINRENYLRFHKGEISDDKFVDSNFEHEGLHDIQRTEIGVWIEAIVIAAQQERERKKMHNPNADVSHASNLLVRYEAIINDPNSAEDKRAHAEAVKRILDSDANPNSHTLWPTLGKGFLRAVELIEMIAPKTG